LFIKTVTTITTEFLYVLSFHSDTHNRIVIWIDITFKLIGIFWKWNSGKVS
jgi:hypothetical protein